jgi:hypothetical protein
MKIIDRLILWLRKNFKHDLCIQTVAERDARELNQHLLFVRDNNATVNRRLMELDDIEAKQKRAGFELGFAEAMKNSEIIAAQQSDAREARYREGYLAGVRDAQSKAKLQIAEKIKLRKRGKNGRFTKK